MLRSRILELLKELQVWLWPVEFAIIVLAFFLAVNAYHQEREARRQQRLVETWQMLKEISPSAIGNVLKHLSEAGEVFTFIDLSRSRHGAPAYLPGLDLFDEQSGKGADFRVANFAGAILREADLS